MEKNIDTLRKFFAISIAVFDFRQSLLEIMGCKKTESYMHQLHLEAKKELDKQEPDMNKINLLLEMMENCANNNK